MALTPRLQPSIGVRKRIVERTGRLSRSQAEKTCLQHVSFRWYDIFCIEGRLNVHLIP
jgi:hypothetical protein